MPVYTTCAELFLISYCTVSLNSVHSVCHKKITNNDIHVSDFIKGVEWTYIQKVGAKCHHAWAQPQTKKCINGDNLTS